LAVADETRNDDPFALPEEVVEPEIPVDEEILGAQEQLGKTLDMARAGEDRVLAVAVREDGEYLVRVLFGLLRMIRLHELDNNAFLKPITEFVGVTARLMDLLGAINLVSVEDQIYINDIRIRFDERMESGRALGEELRRHRVGGINIHQPPTEDHVKVLVHAFAADPDPQAPRTAVQRALRDNGVDCVELFGIFRFRVTGEGEVDLGQSDHTAEEMADVVDRGADLVDESLDNMASSRMPNPLPMRRLVTELIDSGMGAEGLWDEADSISPYGTHVVRVARVSLLIADGLGLPAEAKQDLGVAALFHDVGYAAREGAVAAAPGQEAVKGYAPPFERHPAAGARILLRQRGFHPAKIRRVLATLEHHDDFEGGESKPSLFGRILRIAEDFDNLIRAKGGGLTASDAIGRMMPWSGLRYDPDLLQIFVNAMGKYPPGSMLLLADNRIAVSVGAARDKAHFDKPIVRLVRDEMGRELEEEVLLDLADGIGVRMVLNSRPERLRRAEDSSEA
jgi:HD-GYP domain-containing protein (c-di-GMP phosphodiesterase class II)